jgi:hypothetical protein
MASSIMTKLTYATVTAAIGGTVMLSYLSYNMDEYNGNFNNKVNRVLEPVVKPVVDVKDSYLKEQKERINNVMEYDKSCLLKYKNTLEDLETYEEDDFIKESKLVTNYKIGVFDESVKKYEKQLYDIENAKLIKKSIKLID